MKCIVAWDHLNWLVVVKIGDWVCRGAAEYFQDDKNIAVFARHICGQTMISGSEARGIWAQCRWIIGIPLDARPGYQAEIIPAPIKDNAQVAGHDSRTQKPKAIPILDLIRARATSLRRRSERFDSFDVGFPQRAKLAFAADELEKLIAEIEKDGAA